MLTETLYFSTALTIWNRTNYKSILRCGIFKQEMIILTLFFQIFLNQSIKIHQSVDLGDIIHFETKNRK